MFLGTFSPRLDDKGRLFLPAKFREGLAGGLVITKGQERCLRVFPAAEFDRITERLRDAPMTAKLTRDFQRMMFAGAHDEVPDRQGRVTVPPAAAAVRRADPRLRRRGHEHPSRDLGRRRLGGVRGQPGGVVLEPLRGGAGHLLMPADPTHVGVALARGS